MCFCLVQEPNMLSQDFRPELKGSRSAFVILLWRTFLLSKSDLRKNIRTQRKQLSANVVAQASQIIAEKIFQHPAFLNAQNIALYISHENEIDVTFILNRARELKKFIYLPVLNDKNELAFYLTDSNTQFIKNKFGIDEPMIANQFPISLEELDLMLIPLVAFDAQCNRLGRGAGYYDRTLQFTKKLSRPVLIGVAYEFQKVDQIVADEWDVKMDCIITETTTVHTIAPTTPFLKNGSAAI